MMMIDNCLDADGKYIVFDILSSELKLFVVVIVLLVMYIDITEVDNNKQEAYIYICLIILFETC